MLGRPDRCGASLKIRASCADAPLRKSRLFARGCCRAARGGRRPSSTVGHSALRASCRARSRAREPRLLPGSWSCCAAQALGSRCARARVRRRAATNPGWLQPSDRRPPPLPLAAHWPPLTSKRCRAVRSSVIIFGPAACRVGLRRPCRGAPRPLLDLDPRREVLREAPRSVEAPRAAASPSPRPCSLAPRALLPAAALT